MFKKIAHNSTINSLPTGVSFGNKDLKPLQDLISLEKSIGLSFQKLSADITKASEALRTWGLGEGDDLGDTLTASTHLMLQFATALTNYSTHETTIREHMKSVRGREEALDDSKRRRKAVVAKAEGVEKKVSKMSPEHKNLGMQTDTLNQLRDQIRQMDTEIMAEEASISDFKRTSTKMWMALKFGGLQEVTEKGTVRLQLVLNLRTSLLIKMIP
ncbi:hypothetical protein DL96DRAFT_1594084 [Flagelloscypha sp. PMI_526]|nr:hypothetical protein DL96DRAFT_1594084 [Flagelloscypha sp. PMI_526]